MEGSAPPCAWVNEKLIRLITLPAACISEMIRSSRSAPFNPILLPILNESLTRLFISLSERPSKITAGRLLSQICNTMSFPHFPSPYCLFWLLSKLEEQLELLSWTSPAFLWKNSQIIIFMNGSEPKMLKWQAVSNGANNTTQLARKIGTIFSVRHIRCIGDIWFSTIALGLGRQPYMSFVQFASTLSMKQLRRFIYFRTNQVLQPGSKCAVWRAKLTFLISVTPFSSMLSPQTT